MLESSVTAGVFKWLWNELKQSKFFGVLMAVTSYFAYAYKYSTLRKIILGVGNVENYTETSVFYRILSLSARTEKPHDGKTIFMESSGF